jgi:hypothetical protein
MLWGNMEDALGQYCFIHTVAARRYRAQNRRSTRREYEALGSLSKDTTEHSVCGSDHPGEANASSKN